MYSDEQNDSGKGCGDDPSTFKEYCGTSVSCTNYPSAHPFDIRPAHLQVHSNSKRTRDCLQTSKGICELCLLVSSSGMAATYITLGTNAAAAVSK